jgi:hypothetical protein
LLPSAQAENLIEKSNDVRTILNFQVSDSAVRSLLPAGWQPNPSPSGVSKEANLTLLFTDRLLVQDGEGNFIHGGTNRVIVLIVPAKEIATGINASMVVAGYSGSAEGIPGAYKLYLPGKIQMTRTTRSADKGLGENEELWSLGTATGDQIELAIKYERSIPSRVNAEQKVYTAAVPGFYRIYKVDQGVEVLRSAPSGIDRTQLFRFKAAGPRLGAIFEGTERLVSAISLPWYIRHGFLP